MQREKNDGGGEMSSGKQILNDLKIWANKHYKEHPDGTCSIYHCGLVNKIDELKKDIKGDSRYSIEELPTNKALIIVPEKPLPTNQLNDLAKKLTKLGVKGIISNTKMKVEDLRYSVEELELISKEHAKDRNNAQDYWDSVRDLVYFIKENPEKVKKILEEKT